MPKIKTLKVSYFLGCKVQPEKFQSLDFHSGAELEVDVSDTDGTFEAVTPIYKELYEKLENQVAPPVVEFYDSKGLGD